MYIAHRKAKTADVRSPPKKSGYGMPYEKRLKK
jgi:hypothetical protein